ncbi:MAG: histidine phosphatase family protein [Lachnospiraceae bacterium]|nr:histidine phosphatase family protein [Lachnospiraceae bacterium]
MLYIIRHGTTDWNVLRKLQGRTDIPLNEEGREMAGKAHDEYAETNFDICFCSPLIRARQTADILLEGRDIPIITDDRLMEMSFGDFEGLANSFQIPDCPINVLFKDPANYTEAPGGAESLDELFERTGAFLDEKVYPLLEEGKDVLIVGHGAMNSSIVSRIRGYSRADFWSAGIPNCKLMQLIP